MMKGGYCVLGVMRAISKQELGKITSINSPIVNNVTNPMAYMRGGTFEIRPVKVVIHLNTLILVRIATVIPIILNVFFSPFF